MNSKMTASRSELIALMRRNLGAQGVDLSKPQEIGHGILLFGLGQMAAFTAAAKRQGFRKLQREMKLPVGMHLLSIIRLDSLDAQALGELIEQLDQLAQRFKGQHVGFEVQIPEEKLTGPRSSSSTGKSFQYVEIVGDHPHEVGCTNSAGEAQPPHRH